MTAEPPNRLSARNRLTAKKMEKQKDCPDNNHEPYPPLGPWIRFSSLARRHRPRRYVRLHSLFGPSEAEAPFLPHDLDGLDLLPFRQRFNCRCGKFRGFSSHVATTPSDCS